MLEKGDRRSHTVDDLVTIEETIIAVKVAHLQAEQVLFRDHRGHFIPSEVMHGQCLYIANRIVCLIDHYKAADAELLYRSDELLVSYIRILFMVAIHDEASKCFEALGVDDSVSKPWQKEAYTILADSVDAFHISAVLALVAHKDGATCADDLELMAV